MNIWLKGAAIGLAIFSGICFSQFQTGGYNFSIGAILLNFIISLLAGIVSTFIVYRVKQAAIHGPNNSSLKWYSAPILWVGVPMIALCIYIIVN